MNNECADHSACMGEDQNNDLSYGQLSHSVNIYKSFVDVVGEEQ